MQAAATNIVSLAEYRQARAERDATHSSELPAAPWGQLVVVWIPVWMYPVGYVPAPVSVQVRP